jgi:hypothetical protein
MVDRLALFPSLTYKRTRCQIIRGKQTKDEGANLVWDDTERILSGWTFGTVNGQTEACTSFDVFGGQKGVSERAGFDNLTAHSCGRGGASGGGRPNGCGRSGDLNLR